jgi:hypothetical protein
LQDVLSVALTGKDVLMGKGMNVAVRIARRRGAPVERQDAIHRVDVAAERFNGSPIPCDQKPAIGLSCRSACTSAVRQAARIGHDAAD